MFMCYIVCVCRVRESDIWEPKEFLEGSSVRLHGDQDIQVYQEGMLMRWGPVWGVCVWCGYGKCNVMWNC